MGSRFANILFLGYTRAVEDILGRILRTFLRICYFSEDGSGRRAGSELPQPELRVTYLLVYLHKCSFFRCVTAAP